MSSLSADDVRHIAKLARLNVSDAQVEKLKAELTSILGYVDMLSEVDTTGVEPTAQVTGLSNVLREDIPRVEGVDPDTLLACSSLPVVDHQLVSKSAHG